MTFEQDDSPAIWHEPMNPEQQADLNPTTTTPGLQEPVTPQQPPPDGQNTGTSNRQRLGKLARRFSPVLVPLPFAVLVFLFTLPVALRGQAYLPLLPMGVLLIALVVMQGTLLYYADSNDIAGPNDMLWTLYVIIGYVLFLLVGTLAIFGIFATFVLLFILLSAGSILASRAVHPVPAGYVDIVLSFGKYARTLNPGLNFVMPWEKVHGRLSTQVISWTCPEQTVNISRGQDVKLKATITYQLTPAYAHIAALELKNWEQTLHDSFVATLQSVISELTPADFLSWSQSKHARTSVDINAIDATSTRWEQVNAALARRVQAQVARWGIQVHSVYIQDITLIPHLATSASSTTGMVERPVDVGITRGAASPAAQPLQAQVMSSAVDKRPEPAPVQQAPATGTVPGAENVDMLKDWYEAVRAGRVKDPKTIRDIAYHFAALANDPNIDFDAERAANNLYERAKMYEEKARTSEISNIATKPSPGEQPPAKDNLWKGG